MPTPLTPTVFESTGSSTSLIHYFGPTLGHDLFNSRKGETERLLVKSLFSCEVHGGLGLWTFGPLTSLVPSSGDEFRSRKETPKTGLRFPPTVSRPWSGVPEVPLRPVY